MASRRASLSIRLAILAAACGLGVTAAVSGAAAAALAQPNNPAGANGTVKIDFTPADASRANRPHQTCPFDVQFFGFDAGEVGTVEFNIHPPSGQGDQLLRDEGVPLSGAKTYSGTDLGIPDSFTEHPKQGFHIKLTVELAGGTEKHKVFWLKCAKVSPSPSGSPSGSPSVSPTRTTKAPTAAPTTAPPAPLPVTGTAIGGLAAVGLGLVAGGMALMMIRRRRDLNSMS